MKVGERWKYKKWALNYMDSIKINSIDYIIINKIENDIVYYTIVYKKEFRLPNFSSRCSCDIFIAIYEKDWTNNEI